MRKETNTCAYHALFMYLYLKKVKCFNTLAAENQFHWNMIWLVVGMLEPEEAVLERNHYLNPCLEFGYFMIFSFHCCPLMFI